MKQSGSSSGDRPVAKGEFWTSVLVLVFVAEFFVTIAAVCWGIIMTEPGQDGVFRLAFPWLGWIASMLIVPAGIIALAHMVSGREDVAASEESAREQAWTSQLPDRALRLYRVARNAPVFVICVALLVLGSTLLAIDSAFSLITDIAVALTPYVPYFIGAFTIFVIAIAFLMAWFKHRQNKLMADYAFRREVLERTGVILVNSKGKALLPPDGSADGYAVALIDMGEAGSTLPKDLPVGELPIIEVPSERDETSSS